jgi:hypothetical protein
MRRREFFGRSGSGAAGLVAAPLVLGAQDVPGLVAWKRYAIEIEVIEGPPDGCAQHNFGEKFRYPEDSGKICERLLDSEIGA